MPRIKREVEIDGWTRWIKPVMSGYRLACCDCGLTHDLKFKVEGKSVLYKASRNKRSKAAMRRKRPGS